MDPEHLAEGSFPKDEKSVYELFLCKPVSYTHLDVYKRQTNYNIKKSIYMLPLKCIIQLGMS